jgi:N-methylhydantoinase A
MRYLGQNYEHEVAIPTDAITAGRLRTTYDAFTRVHEERYGYAIQDEVIELVSFRVTASGRRPSPLLTVTPDLDTSARQPDREIHYRGHGWVLTTVLRRYTLAPGTTIDGPCVLEEPGSTTLVEPGMMVTVLPDGQLLITTEVGNA